MELSDIEKKMVARLRRKQAQMVRLRWWILLSGIFCFAVSGYGYSVLSRALHEPDLMSVLAVAALLPQIYICMFVGAGAIGYAWANWNGNPQDRLLLRLIDEKRDT
jgi:hypothetical protein